MSTTGLPLAAFREMARSFSSFKEKGGAAEPTGSGGANSQASMLGLTERVFERCCVKNALNPNVEFIVGGGLEALQRPYRERPEFFG